MFNCLQKQKTKTKQNKKQKNKTKYFISFQNEKETILLLKI